MPAPHCRCVEVFDDMFDEVDTMTHYKGIAVRIVQAFVIKNKDLGFYGVRASALNPTPQTPKHLSHPP